MVGIVFTLSELVSGSELVAKFQNLKLFMKCLAYHTLMVQKLSILNTLIQNFMLKKTTRMYQVATRNR